MPHAIPQTHSSFYPHLFKTMISGFFLLFGAFLNHKPINKPAKNNKRILIAAVFHFVEPVQKEG